MGYLWAYLLDLKANEVWKLASERSYNSWFFCQRFITRSPTATMCRGEKRGSSFSVADNYSLGIFPFWGPCFSLGILTFEDPAFIEGLTFLWGFWPFLVLSFVKYSAHLLICNRQTIQQCERGECPGLCLNYIIARFRKLDVLFWFSKRHSASIMNIE